jgi:hypothetical protein
MGVPEAVRIAACLAGCSLALLLAACAREQMALAPASSDARAEGTGAVFGLVFHVNGYQGEVARLDSRTLRPRGRRVQLLPSALSAPTFSPDGSRLAVGMDVPPGVQFVDVERMRRAGHVRMRGPGFVAAMAWPAPRRLYAAIEAEGAEVLAVDPARARVVARHRLGGHVLHARPTPDGIAVLLAPTEGIGPVMVAVVGADGVRTARLEEVEGGWRHRDARLGAVRQEIPGFAVDPSGARAVVVPAGRRVAEVDLRTLEVTYHGLGEPVSLVGRFRNWLEPAAEAKIVDGPWREAVWLDERHVAVAGVDSQTNGGPGEERMVPAGATLIDTAEWTVRMLDREASGIAYTGGTLLVYRPRSGPASRRSRFVVGYDAGGRERFATGLRREVDEVEPAGRYAYVVTGGGVSFHVLDTATGRIVRAASPPRATSILVQPG